MAEYINLHEALRYCTAPCNAAICSTGLPLAWLLRLAKGSAVEKQRITEKVFFSCNEVYVCAKHINMADDLREPAGKTIQSSSESCSWGKSSNLSSLKRKLFWSIVSIFNTLEGKMGKLILLLQHFYLFYLVFSKSQFSAIRICKLLKWKAFKSVDWKRSKYHISIEEAKSEGDARNCINVSFSTESQMKLVIDHQGEMRK